MNGVLKVIITISSVLSMMMYAPQALSMSEKAKKIHSEIISQVRLYDDVELTKYVEGVGKRVAEVSGDTTRTYRFFILDDPGVNAFTPGHGLIYMNRGLLTMMTSEAQLAGVLAHEVGHNVGNHLGRRQSQQLLSGAASLVASILAGNTAVGNSLALADQKRLKGFGRAMELEADEYAAQWLYAAKYDPNEMFHALSIFKDFERFTYIASDGQTPAYHGSFSTHPRNDRRLKEIIAKAGVLPPGEAFRGRAEWRKVMDGVVIGPNHAASSDPTVERYIQKQLSITFLHPKSWKRTVKGNKIVLKNSEDTLQLKITTERVDEKSQKSREMLHARYPESLVDIESFNPDIKDDSGSTGRFEQSRVGAFSTGRYGYYFQGISKDGVLTSEEDEQLTKIIKSFRRLSRQDLESKDTYRIVYHRIEPGESFSSVNIPDFLGANGEAYLRLINGYFPRGEPEPGTYVKLIEKVDTPRMKEQE